MPGYTPQGGLPSLYSLGEMRLKEAPCLPYYLGIPTTLPTLVYTLVYTPPCMPPCVPCSVFRTQFSLQFPDKLHF